MRKITPAFTLRCKACKGFTLIELLVVISIIGILVTLSLVSFSVAQKQARDTRRKSDLKQYQALFENYAAKNNSIYPATFGGTYDDITEHCTNLGLTDSSTCIDDPREPSASAFNYRYSSVSPYIEYVLTARMDDTSEYFVICSNGKSGMSTGWVNDGACPL